MEKDEFELMLQKEESKIQELKAAFDHVLKSKPSEDESKYSTSPLNKYNLRFSLYDADQIEDKVDRSKSKIFKKILIFWIILFIFTICLFLFIKIKIFKNTLENKNIGI